LESGIIGIVGPNGCGKSNIYDAVQWVLGEQSAKELRGDEISDVIARGNVRRAEKKTAEAYLTFEECQDTLDTDRDQVEVGRQVDTDGQGTYYLNGEEVRLKDVQDLFRDTGIGQDLYSSIGQGEVLNLIESKPEDRREIIEEAAGIASYRHRRDLTKRRLDRTRTELEQVEKDLREKKGRLSQLQGQAEKAEEVRELQSELRSERLRLARRDYVTVHEKLENLDDKLEDNKERLQQLTEQKSDITDRKSQLQSLQQSVESKLNRLKSLAEPVRRRRQERREKRSEFRTRLDSLREQRKRESKNVEQLRRQHRSELDSLADSYEDRYRARLRGSISEVELDVLTDHEDRLVERRRELQNKREHLREKSLFKQTEIREIERELEAHQEDLEDLRSEIRGLREDLSSLSREAEAAGDRLAEARTSYFHAESDYHELRYRNQIRSREQAVLDKISEALYSRKNEIRNRINRLEKRRDTLNGRIESRDGIPEGSRQLVESDQPERTQHLEGLLAEHVEVQERAGTAVEAVVGERLQDVLVQSFESIQVLWDELEDHPVRLRPIEGASSSSVSSELRNAPDGAIAPLRSFVTASDRAKPLLDRLLADVYLVEDLSTLMTEGSEPTESNDGWTYVDPEGNLCQSDGTVSFREGDRQGGGLLRWKQERSRVEEEKEEAEKDLRILENYLDRIETLNERVEREQQQVEGSLQGLQNEIRNNRETIREARHERNRSWSLVEDKLEVLQDRENQRLVARNRLRADRSIQELVTNRGTDRTDTIQELENRVEELDGTLSGLRTKQRSAEQKRSVSESRRQESESRIAERNDRLTDLVENVRETRDHLSELDRQRLRTRRSLSESRLALGWTEEELSTYDDLRSKTRKQRDQVSRKLDEVNENLRERDRTIEQVRGRIDKTESERSNQQARRSELVEKIEDELDVQPAEDILEAEQADPERERKDIASRVRTLKSDIRELQPVNMLASEEAEELEDEVTEVQEQYDDLQDSCDKLESLIDRLNDKARTQFREAFDEIQDYFEDHIEELFQGGRGSMELTEGPVLEAGVKFEIEPPGEQLRTMSALSGGEKTLGALAFLFALYERKSTPFCFLDEVDHPLDDENVHQFIRLLSRYRDKTQFIVITHNKLTMQATDKLFGITMEESGVTSIVPMELEDAEDLREPQEVG
jgi:chromosome segregation protein